VQPRQHKGRSSKGFFNLVIPMVIIGIPEYRASNKGNPRILGSLIKPWCNTMPQKTTTQNEIGKLTVFSKRITLCHGSYEIP